MPDDDKFPMHADFPMDERFLAKALERQFTEERALYLFSEWRSYWCTQPETERKLSGWLRSWDDNLKRKAKNNIRRGSRRPGGWQPRREDRPMPEHEWRGEGNVQWPYSIALGAKMKADKGHHLTQDEREALGQWFPDEAERLL